MEETDLVFYGTPIEREEDATSRKKKAVAEASGQLRTLPSWKQEVRDEEGRRRFHGAFTGGYSAGYYNTVGSKEGWAPQSFTSSRKSRAEIRQQDILNFLDEDEKADLEGRSLGTSSQFDTFGFTASEVARKQADKEPSAIPGPVPDELVLPAAESIGVKLLLKMGWRHGRTIKDSSADSLYDARRKARKAFLAFSSNDDAKSHIDHNKRDENDHQASTEGPVNDDNLSSKKTPLYSLEPKQDSYGLGYDPYKHAPEFRGKAAPGFGIGALEEYDVEDEDVYNSTAYEFEDTVVQEIEDSSKSTTTDHMHRLTWKEQGVLRGFKVASISDYQMERFNAPEVPKDFVPRHKFAGPLKVEDKTALPPPPEVPPPEDNNLKVLIVGVATLVARCGKLFEDLSREKNQSNPAFGFLMGGKGREYYERKLWEEQQKHTDHKKISLDEKTSPSLNPPKMNAENRGKILGERPLERSSGSSLASQEINHQSNLSDTFTKPLVFSELPEVVKPFKDDPAKQDRFQQFLKQKYQGGLRSADSGGSSYMSEAVRAQERLDFELAADALEKANRGNENKFSAQMSMDFFTNAGMQFTSAGVEQINSTRDKELAMKGMYPKREEYQWRPAPVLCKRFDLVDPYMGKLPPPPRTRGKIDSLVFKSEVIPVPMIQDKPGENQNRSSGLQSNAQVTRDGSADEEPEVEVEVENVERPVDLYKAIFSDDSDEETEAPIPKQVEDPEKKIEVANATLNRLMAGDFLESLGKELGLEVPPDLPYFHTKANQSVPEKDDRSNRTKEGKRHRSPPSTSHRKRRESTSSDDEVDRRSSRHRRHYDDSSDSSSESSDDDRDRHRSKSKARRKESSSSRDKKKSSSSRKHSRHRHHRSSKSSSSRRSGEHDGEGKREKRKRRD
ncbi:G patch domain-containing protein TGH [Linum perenne]